MEYFFKPAMEYITSHKYKFRLFLLILFYITGYTVSDATVKMKFNRIDAGLGLSNSRVNNILQDTRGFIWLCTEDGLNRFDGYEFKVYRNLPKDTNSLLKNSIACIYEDSHGLLWISTAVGGLHIYNSKLDNFIRIPAYSFDCEITQITEDFQKNLWIAGIKSRHPFVARLDKSTKQWQEYIVSSSKTSIYYFSQASGNEFWIGIRGVGFYKWNMDSNILKSYLPDKNNPHSILSTYFHCAIRDSKGNIWIATRDGLSKFMIKSEEFTNYPIKSQNNKPKLLINSIWELCEDGNYIWIGTENGGLTRLNTKNNETTHFRFDKYDPLSLVDNSIWSIYKDTQGRIWIGTYSKGVCVIDKLKEKFSELDIPLENDVVNAIWQDSRKRIWIGTEEGIAMKDGKQVRYYKHSNTKGSLASNPVLSIFEDSRQQMWFGTWAGGLHRYDESNNNFVRYLPDETNPHNLSSPHVFCIKELAQTKQLLAGTYNGLNVLTDESKGWFEKHKEPKFEFNSYIHTIYEDSRGNVWIGTLEELILYDSRNKKITRFNRGNNIDSIKVGGLVKYITEDRKGRLWVGSSNGLHLIVNKKFIRRYTTEDGLPNNIVNGILEDDKGNLWLSTTQGISRFNPELKTFKNYEVSDGLLSTEFKPGACFKNAEGRFFFGGKGVNVFYPDSVKENPHVPPVFITDLKLFNQSVSVGSKDGILKQQISETKEIFLSPLYNFFTINYVALNFTAPNKNQYTYKLEGFNDDWIPAGNHRFATFTNLDPGTYIFRVKASNNDGLWNEKGASLTIHIMPPWWKTWWFRVLVIILVISGVFVGFKIKLARERLKNEIKLKNNELELKSQTLLTFTLRLAEKRRFIEEIKSNLQSATTRVESEKVLAEVKMEEFLQKEWSEFTEHFESVNPAFFKKILELSPSLTPNELKLCALLKLNLRSKEISSILRVHPESVIKARYRIRKKLNIEGEDNLVTYLMNL